MKTFFEKIRLIFDIENWLWKYDFGTFCQFTKYSNFIWIQLIFEQKPCFLRPIKWETPWRNWHYYTSARQYTMCQCIERDKKLFLFYFKSMEIYGNKCQMKNAASKMIWAHCATQPARNSIRHCDAVSAKHVSGFFQRQSLFYWRHNSVVSGFFTIGSKLFQSCIRIIK